jgi:hypothetical protein
MIERLHTPPTHDPIAEKTPLVFLAGPIQGARDWQAEATTQLLAANGTLEVASPRRVSLDSTFVYDEQVAWEKAHLARSAQLGAIIFWFAAQDYSQNYEPGRPYAKTTKIEFGRAFGWYDKQPFPIVVGIEPGFEPVVDGAVKEDKYLRSLPIEQGIAIYTSLDEVVQQAIASVT